jgi:DNA-binding response OmpR family regulator
MKILVVEDDGLVQKSLRRVLRRAGFDVLDIVDSVRAGESRLAESQPDVLLLDREVIGGVGWSLREKAPQGCRVVLMTAAPPADAPSHYLKGGQPVSTLVKMVRGEDAI